MTDATLKVIFEYTPSILGAVFAGVAAIVSAFALKKGTENGVKADVANEKADVANVKADVLVAKADELHTLANGNLSKITEDLRVANENIANLRGIDDKRLITVLERHQLVLNRLDGDMTTLTSEVRGVRDRQHALANFLNGVGLKFELKPIELQSVAPVELKPIAPVDKTDKK